MAAGDTTVDTGGEFSGAAAMSAAAFVRQAESARENGFAELSTREQATNSEFATSVKITFRPSSPFAEKEG
jgi:hypothetical protein